MKFNGLSREELRPINTDEPDDFDTFIDRKVGRAVARCLDDLGTSVPPATQRSIKHWLWNLADDIKEGYKNGEAMD